MPKDFQKIIPKNETEIEMPTTLQVLFKASAFDGGELLTEESLKQIVKKIRKGKNLGVYLYWDMDLEGDYMQIEISNALVSLQYVENDGTDDACFYSSFNPEYLDSEEWSPMQASDGQSIILMRYTMEDFELAAKCFEYFARTGKLYSGMEWLKG